jgi:hypothetical protein
MRAMLLAAVLAVGTIATAQAQVPHQRADGLWVCPNDESRIIVNGDWRVVCFTNAAPSISMQEFKAARDEWQMAQDAEAARVRKFNRESGRCTEVPRPSSCDD